MLKDLDGALDWQLQAVGRQLPSASGKWPNFSASPTDCYQLLSVEDFLPLGNCTWCGPTSGVRFADTSRPEPPLPPSSANPKSYGRGGALWVRWHDNRN